MTIFVRILIRSVLRQVKHSGIKYHTTLNTTFNVVGRNNIWVKVTHNINHYTKYCIQCHQFYSSCSILYVNRMLVLPTLNVTYFYLSHFVKKIGQHKFTQIGNYCHLLGDFSSKFQSSMAYFITKCWDTKYTKICFINWHLDELIISRACEPIHKKCHKKITSHNTSHYIEHHV